MELEGGNHARVIELLEPLYREVKDRFEVLAPLGEAYFREQRFEEAAEVLERVVALRRPDPSVLNMLANAVYRLGNSERAQELLEKSLELDPNQKGVEEILGKIKAERSGR
jgi:Flp pilus assembly protein TadD